MIFFFFLILEPNLFIHVDFRINYLSFLMFHYYLFSLKKIRQYFIFIIVLIESLFTIIYLNLF